jgi:DNA-binding transcriptional LysR family regulator
MSTVVMPPLLSLFRQRHPNIDIELVTGTTLDLHARLIDGELDCCLLVASESAEDPLVVEHSWQVELILASRLPQTPKRCSLARLKTYPFLMLRKGSRLQDLIDRYLAGYRFQPQVVVRSDSVEALLAMVKAGNGIAMLPGWLVEAPLRRGELSAIRQKEPPLLFSIDLVRRRTGYVPPALQAFLQLVRAEALLPRPWCAKRPSNINH